MSELKLQQCRLDGRYDVLDCLGRGSYSEVYVARDAAAANGSPHTVVIKALNTHLQGELDRELEQTLLDNFRNEAVALDRVRHPHIINRLGHGTAIDLQGRVFHYLVFEYLPGGDLQALCRRHPLSLTNALSYLEQVSTGLQFAHNHGVIHRDIKPQNLLLSADHRTVKIADFGVAKIEAAEGAITRVGTDVYAAPEHHPLAQTGPLDTGALSSRTAQLTPAADVYSLAKTAYMLLTGEAPRRFSQKPIAELPESIAGKPWAPFVLRVLRRATQTNPESRYQSVSEFWDELKDATMPQTQLLHEAGSRSPSLDNGKRAADNGLNALVNSVMPAPPAPVFERPIEPFPQRPGSKSNARIIVPITHEEAIAPSPVRRAQVSPAVVSPPAPFHTPRAPVQETSRLSPRVRNWLVALLLIVAFAAILLATHTYVRRLRPAETNSSSQSATNSASVVGDEFVAITDVKLRPGPATNSGREVGIAEKDSLVEVVRANGSWYEVRIKQHGRPKDDPASSDQGWVNSKYLKAK